MFKFRWCCLAAVVVVFAAVANASTLDYFYGFTPQNFGPTSWATGDPLRSQNVSFSTQASPYTVVTNGMPFMGYVEPNSYSSSVASSGPAYTPVAAPDAGNAAMSTGMGGSGMSSAWGSPFAGNYASSSFANLYTGSLAPVNISWQALDVPVTSSGLTFNGMSWGASGPTAVTVAPQAGGYNPEPSSWVLLATGVGVLAYLKKRRTAS